MLPSQRALFDIPRDVCFLNAASWSPLPLASQEAGRAAIGRKGQPWKLAPDFAGQQYERARRAAIRAIELDPQLPEGHVSLGMIQAGYDFDWVAADQSGQRALALAPGNASAPRRPPRPPRRPLLRRRRPPHRTRRVASRSRRSIR